MSRRPCGLMLMEHQTRGSTAARTPAPRARPTRTIVTSVPRGTQRAGACRSSSAPRCPTPRPLMTNSSSLCRQLSAGIHQGEVEVSRDLLASVLRRAMTCRQSTAREDVPGVGRAQPRNNWMHRGRADVPPRLTTRHAAFGHLHTSCDSCRAITSTKRNSSTGVIRRHDLFDQCSTSVPNAFTFVFLGQQVVRIARIKCNI